MQKEVLTNKIRAFAEFALSNPLTAQKVDVTELLQQTWDVMEIGKESPVLDEKKGPPPEVAQAMQQMQGQMQQMGQALQQATLKIQSMEADRDEKMKKLEVEAYAKINDRLKTVVPMMTPEEINALVMSTLQQALQNPDPVPNTPIELRQAALQPPMPPQGAMPPEQPAAAGFSSPDGQ